MQSVRDKQTASGRLKEITTYRGHNQRNKAPSASDEKERLQ